MADTQKPREQRDVVQLIDTAIDLQIERGRPVTVLHLTEADWLAVRAFKEGFPAVADAHGKPSTDDPRPRYRLIPIDRSTRNFSFAAIAPQFINGQIEAPWIPLNDALHLTAGGTPFASPEAQGGDTPKTLSVAGVGAATAAGVGSAAGAATPIGSAGGVRREDTATAPATGLGLAAGAGPSPSIIGQAYNTQPYNAAPPQAGTSPSFSMGPDHDRDSVGNVLLTDEAGRFLTDEDGNPLLVESPAQRGEQGATSHVDSRPIIPDDGPASLRFTVGTDGRIGVMDEPADADQDPEAVAGMFAAARSMAAELIDDLILSNADRRFVDHLTRLHDSLPQTFPDQAAVFRVGREPTLLRRYLAQGVQGELGDLTTAKIEALADHLEGCAAQFPAWVRFARNAIAAALSAEQAEKAIDLAKTLIAAIQTDEGRRVVQPSAASAFQQLIDSGDGVPTANEPTDENTVDPKKAADILQSVGNFLKAGGRWLLQGAVVEVGGFAAKWLLNLLFGQTVAGSGLIVAHFILIQFPAVFGQLAPLVEFLKALLPGVTA